MTPELMFIYQSGVFYLLLSEFGIIYSTVYYDWQWRQNWYWIISL